MESATEAKNPPQTDAMAGDGLQDYSTTNSADSLHDRFRALLGDIPGEFDSWESLVSTTENNFHNDIQRICLVYDVFLAEFPLCYGYWIRYANHKARLCTLSKVEEIYERAIEAVPFSVDLWVSYCTFAVLSYEDPADIQRLFKRGTSLVKKDYVCHRLWDKYADFEYSQKNWSEVAYIYIRTLQYPTKKLQTFYEKFRKLVDTCAEGIGYKNKNEIESEAMLNCGQTYTTAIEDIEILSIIKELLEPKGLPGSSSLEKYFLIGEHYYQRSSQVDKCISCFENRIKRRFFDAKPVDDCQLQNWHEYLDFIEKQEDFDWAVKLYERCLAPCASYPEFWIRYVEFVDAKGGRELANLAISRALTVFLKKNPTFHLYSAMFKEKIGDASGARAVFCQWELIFSSDLIENINRKANLERRMGNIGAAYVVYEKAIETAKVKQDLQIIPVLYNNFARFAFMVCGRTDAAIEVFVKGLQEFPCKSILEGLIHFITLHGGAAEMHKLDSLISSAIDSDSDLSRALSSHDREYISRIYLEFVDTYGTVHDIRKSWFRHMKLFPHITKPVFNNVQKSIPFTNETATAIPQIACLDNSNSDTVKDITEHLTVGRNSGMLLEDLSCIPDLEEGKKCTTKVDELMILDEQRQPLGKACELNMVHNEQGGCSDVAQSLSNDSRAQSQALYEENPGNTVRPVMPESLTKADEKQHRAVTVEDSNSLGVDTSYDSKIGAGRSTADVPEVYEPDLLGIRSSRKYQARVQEDEDPSLSASESPSGEAQNEPKMSLEVQSQPDLHHDISLASISGNPGNNAPCADIPQNDSGRRTSDYPSSIGLVHSQASQPQQWQVDAQSQYSIGHNPQLLAAQSYQCQPQMWMSAPGQQPEQNLYHIASAQSYQTASLPWAAQYMQQQGFVYQQSVQSNLPVSQPQIPLYQQSSQNNGQYGYYQNAQEFAPHVWHYYQQQLYFLQQQQQQQQHHHQQHQHQSQQHLNSEPGRQSQIAQLQENHGQQNPQQNQQMVFQMQQPNNQQESKKQDLHQHLSPSLQNQNQQHEQQQQQQQEPLVQQRSDQSSQQEQQLLCLQPQQQLYLQQQQLYMQQVLQYQQHQQTQQILQQQPQLTEQQLLLYQQQQLFQMQQQQQQQQLSIASGSQTLHNNVLPQDEEAELQNFEQSGLSQATTPQQTPTKKIELSKN